MGERCACTRAAPPSTTRRTSEISARSSSRTCCGACFAAARMEGAAGDEPDGCGRQDHRARGRAGEDDPRGDASPSPRSSTATASSCASSAPKLYPEGDRLHPGDDRARRAADGARRGVSGRGRLGVLRDRELSRIRQALAPRHARDSRGRTRRQDDYNKENARDFALWKAAKPEDEQSGRGVGFAVGARPPGLASRVLGDGQALPRRDARPSRGRRRPHLSPPRGRDRAERGRERGRRSRACGATASSCSPTAPRWRSASGTSPPSSDLRDAGMSAAAVRHFMFSAHYRKQLNLSEEALEASGKRCVGWATSRSGCAVGRRGGTADS